MAFGDHTRVQNTINSQGGLAQNKLNDLSGTLGLQNQNLWNRFQVAADKGEKDYGNLSNQYSSYLKGPGIGYNPSQQNFGAYGGYQDFANTGGYSPQNISDIRARSVAPLRATYQNAQNDLDRRNVLAGGNLANYAAAKSQMSRQLGNSLADQSTNIEAQLAQDIRNGKLSGLQGMTGIDTSKMGEGLANAGQNLNAQNMESNRQLQGLSGQTSLYGTTPGQANMYGNQLNQSNQNGIQMQQLQQQLMQAILSGTLGMASTPGNFQSAMGNISSGLGLAGQIGGMFGGVGGSSSYIGNDVNKVSNSIYGK